MKCNAISVTCKGNAVEWNRNGMDEDDLFKNGLSEYLIVDFGLEFHCNDAKDRCAMQELQYCTQLPSSPRFTP